MDTQPHPLLHFIVRMKPTRRPRMSFFRSPEMCKSHGEKSRLSYSIPGRFHFMARRSTLSHRETNHTSLLFSACPHFQCWTNTLLTSTAHTDNNASCTNCCWHSTERYIFNRCHPQPDSESEMLYS